MKATPRLTRRQFLRVTSAAAAGAPLILHSSSRAADKPSDRITLGFIGSGKQGRILLNDFVKRPDVQVAAVCDVDWNRRESLKKHVVETYAKQTGQSSWTGCDAYGDFHELLAREDIDAVVISTPDHWHALHVIAAAAADKDIYCEKPLCQSVREARAMADAVRVNKRVFQMGSQQRSMREFRTSVELIRNGVIGRINRIEVGVGGGPAVPCDLPREAEEPGLNWNHWLGPAPWRPYNSTLSPRGVHDHYPAWRNYREYGGGLVTDWGAHHFDIIQWALDLDGSGPVEIFPASEPNAQTGVRFVYASGVEAVHVPGNGLTFHGSEGKLFVARGKFELTVGPDKKADSPAKLDDIAAEYLTASAKRVYHSGDQHGNWLECIRSRKPTVAGAEVGARTVTVCHLVNFAYYHGQRLKWNPEKETFADGTGDRKWLEVPYRDPWKLS